MQTTPPRAGWLRNRDRFALDIGIRRRTELAPASTRTAGAWRTGILRLRALLAQRSTVWAIIAASMMLCAPAVVTGLVLDDYFHTLALRTDVAAPGVKRAPWDAYTFAASPSQIKVLVEESVVPWWSDPEARLSFFRPLSSLTLWLDHHAWPKAPVLMHMHSLVWYALLLIVIAHVYRRFSARAFSSGFAGLALLLYAVDDAHAMSVGWLANRAALIALTFGFSVLLAHDSWRNTGRTRYLVGALSLLALALAAGEAALQTLGYLAAYALCFDSGPKRARWRSLLPYAALIIVWHTAYEIAGYGATRTALYLDPIAHPLTFLHAVAVRLPVLLASQFGGLSADVSDWLRYAPPMLAALFVPLTVAVVAVVAWVVYPLWSTRREVRFWLVGTVLATLPVCAVAPADRLLVGTGLGGSALIAIVLLAALDRARELRSPGRRFWATTLGVIHLAISPLLLPVQAYGLTFLESYIGRAERSIPDGAEVADKTVMLLNPPSDEFGIYMTHHRRVRGGVMPEHVRWLANGDSDLLITRLDDHALKVKPQHGFLPPGSFWTLRTPDFKSYVGDRVSLDGTSFTVTDVTADGRPAEVLVKLDRPLDSAELIWMRWDNRDGFVRFSLPKAGQSMLVPAADTKGVLAGGEDHEALAKR
jgi:hypothetical protein